MKKPILLLTIALVLALALVLSPLTIDIDRSNPGHLWGKVYIGNTVTALDLDVDYECDGLNDEVQFRAALAALPPEAGMLYVQAGSYQFGNNQTVTCNLTGVSIVGLGSCTTFTGDGTTPLFQAGNDGWLFMNLKTDAGGIDMAETEAWCWINVAVGTTLHSVLTDQGAPSGMEQHGNEWHSINFATVTTVADLETQVDGLEVDLLALDTTVTDILSDIVSLNTTLVDLGVSVDSISTDLGTAQTDIQALEATSHTQGTDTALGTLGTLGTPATGDKVVYRDLSDSDALVTSTMGEVRTFFHYWYDTLYADITHASTHAVGATDTIFPADPDADRLLEWDDSESVFVWVVSGDMLKSVYDVDEDGDIDTAAGGTEWDSSSATGVVEVTSGVWGTRSDIPGVTTGDVTLYVDAGSGSDSNSGSSGSPKATILGALDALPIVIAHTCTIKVRPGTYAEENTYLVFDRFDTLAYINIYAVNDDDEEMYGNGQVAGTHSTTTLQDTSKSWSTDQFDGAYLWIYSGNVNTRGQIAEITSNTANTLTFSGGMTYAPVNDDYYGIGGGVLLSGTNGYHMNVVTKSVGVYGFQHTGATTASVMFMSHARGNYYYNYHPSVASVGVYLQRLSDASIYYNYFDLTGDGNKYGVKVMNSSGWPRGNVFVGDDSGCTGVDITRIALGQMTSAAAYKSTFGDLSLGVNILQGSGCLYSTVQFYDSCVTDRSVDGSSWES